MSIDLRLDQNQVYEYDHKVMFDVFVAKLAAVLAYCQAYTVTAGGFICALIFGVEGLDGKATFYANWHLIWASGDHKGIIRDMESCVESVLVR
jgi:hypothetical protein